MGFLKKFLLAFFSVTFAVTISYHFLQPSTDYISRKEKDRPYSKAQRIGEAFKLDFKKTVDPNLGYVPKERLTEARKIADQKIKTRNLRKSAVASATWTERGPDNVGGRTRALMWDPNTINKVWAGSSSGGLWYINDITNASATWTKVDDFWDNIGVVSIAYDPNNTNIFYAGTGENWRQGDFRGEGIWKSTDAGATWAQLQSSTAFYYVNDLVVRNESGSSVLYACTDYGYDKGQWHGSGSNGIMRSTDGGLTFTKVGPNIAGKTHPIAGGDIEIAADNRIWVGSVKNAWGEGGGIIMYSDDGTSWTVDSTSYHTISGVGRIDLAVAPSNASVLYGLVEANSVVQNVIYTSNKGASWQNKTEPNDQDPGIPSSDFSRGQAWYDLIIQVDPNDANTAICGGIDLFKTTNAASSWSQLSHWYGLFGLYPEVHADQHQIMFKTGSSSEVIFANDGGVFYSSNGGTSFTMMNNDYNVTQFYACAIHPTSATDHFLAGAQDNGSHSFTSSGMNSTTEVSGGDGAYTHIDQDEPTYQFTSYVYNNFYRSTNGGSSFSSVDHADDGHFINPSDYDDANDRMYAADKDGFYLLWSNPQSGSSFTEKSLTALSGQQVSAVTVSPHTANRVFFGTENGDLIRVDNAHASTSETVINSGFGMPTSWINCVEIDPNDENHIVLIFSNFGISNVWETTDGGTSWSDCEGDLPDMPIRWALINPDNEKEVLLATELGVWSTDMLNGTETKWEPANASQANVRTDMLKTRSSDNLVIAATHGRGLWSTDVFANVNAGFSVSNTIAYVNQSISFTDGSIKATSWSWNFGDGNSSTSQNPSHSYTNPGTYTVALTINAGADTETRTNLIHVMPSLGTPFTPALGGNFESNPNYFDSESTNGFIDVWEMGTPTNALTTLNSGTNGWKTLLDSDASVGNYTSVLYTPSFNFTAAGSYSLHFRKSMEASGSNAPFGVFVEYSINDGATWTRLGSNGDGNGTNWYDQSTHDVATGGHAWSGNYSNEATSYDCSSLAGNSSVAFRFVFMMSKFYTAGYNQDGFMIDDFEIQGETNDTSLPVELSSFTVAQTSVGKGFKLQWKTESELENAFWIIEKKSSGTSFIEIAQLNGQGTKATATEYSFLDQDVDYNSTYTYRIADISYAGKIEYHDEITATLKLPQKFELAQNYPNPFNPSTTINYSLAKDENVKLEVYSISGQLVKTLVKENQSAGNYNVVFEANNLASGIYIYRLSSGKQTSIRKMTLLK
ncbi:MAG: T9SS C-terminal target domain-containing protein [Calditrichaeota bacterium]|nr:MAG: T9SS C-terminal target domain-containing protein [Calditrichota bacterium]MBL1206588.1 T9SS C-terminal target domain-containing protein [Calditrichota bacterium]NOG46415.1 T9SS type A sorting domain-containing protein [Calditrichota bacterium]